MNDNIKKFLQNLAQQVGTLLDDNNSQLIGEDALNNILLSEDENSTKASTIYITFTKKEIKQMPEYFRRKLLIQGLQVSCRKRVRGKNLSLYTYELRYRKDGYNISASAHTIEVAKRIFLDKIKDIKDESDYPKIFVDFCSFYVENYKKKKVCEKSYKVDLGRIKNDLKPFFKNKKTTEITPIMCQTLIDNTIKDGFARKAEDIKNLLNQVLEYAKKLNLIKINPIDLIVYFKHEREHGKALAKEEEKLLLLKTEGTPYQHQFAVALYTGLRPNEYETARIEGNFIIAKNSKRKNGKIEYKKIPITPMLKPYVEGIERLNFYYYETILEKFKSILPNHKLYDLRTTFFNRCIECKIQEPIRDEWLGHHSNSIKTAYTDISDELHLLEGAKFVY